MLLYEVKLHVEDGAVLLPPLPPAILFKHLREAPKTRPLLGQLVDQPLLELCVVAPSRQDQPTDVTVEASCDRLKSATPRRTAAAASTV